MDAVALREIDLSLALVVLKPDRANLIFCQFRATSFFSQGLATLRNLVVNVRPAVSQKQMIWVAALRVVTAMKNPATFRDWAIRSLVGNSMRPFELVAVWNVTVSVSIAGSGPFQTASRFIKAHVLFKGVDNSSHAKNPSTQGHGEES